MHAVARTILALKRRMQWRSRLVALFRIAATILAAAIGLGIVDYIVRFSDPGMRILSTGVLIVAVVWAIYSWWYLPLRNPLGPLHVARRIEAHFPQLRDSLASAVEFLQQSEHDSTAGSAQLRRLVVSETETTLSQLPLEDVIDKRPLRLATGWFLLALFAVGVCSAFNPQATAISLARLVMPLGSAEWPRRNYLEFQKVPARLAAGQTFEVELIDTGGHLPDEVFIKYRSLQNDRREFTAESMTRVGDRMLARRESLRNSFAFRATGGDDDTMRWHTVEVIEPPRLESFEILVHPPPYTGATSASANRHLNVIKGTGIEVRGRVDQPITSARLLLDDASPIIASLELNADNKHRVFRVSPSQWIASKSGPYQLELADRDGLAVIVGQWYLRVKPDPPPTIAWRKPIDDLYVTPTAVVPIELSVQDNLAIERVDLTHEHSELSGAEREQQSADWRIELYQGPATPPACNDPLTATGDNRNVKYELDLQPFELPIGAELVLHAEAADYRPGIGRTIDTRRIRIITVEELAVRLAEQQEQIVRQLERALKAQRTTREDIRVIEARQQEALLGEEYLKLLQATEINQRRIGRMLTDSDEGIPALVGALRANVEMNGNTNEDVMAVMDLITKELDRLAEGPLAIAESGLIAARTLPSASLSKVSHAQHELIDSLDQLIAKLTEDAKFQRIVRQIGELRQDQLSHMETTRSGIGLTVLPLRSNELTRSQQAALSSSAAGQSVLAQRYDKIESNMDQLAESANEHAETLADAVSLARRLAIGSAMHQAAHEIGDKLIAQALEREAEIADSLQQVLDVLRKQQSQDTEQQLKELLAAEQRLAALQSKLTEFRREIMSIEQLGEDATTTPQLEDLYDRQQALRREIEQLARQLERSQAANAAKTTKQAASRLEDRDSQQRHPNPSRQIEQAEDDLNKAARQLAEQRQQQEDDLALHFVRRFQAKLSEMVGLQKRILEDTIALHNQQGLAVSVPESAQLQVAKLASEERRLAEQAREHSELLFGLGAVRVGLQEAKRRLVRAAEMLEQREIGPTTQAAESAALERLEDLQEAFKQTADEADQNRQTDSTSPTADGDQQQQQRRPTFELLEVKVLRALQVDLNNRTADFRQRLTEVREPTNVQQSELAREAQELANDQRRLAELVETMLATDNGEKED